MELHSYYRSTASWRVRIALHWKGLAFETRSVASVRKGEAAATAAFLGMNPQGMVPVLGDGPLLLNQSLAICEYLEETHPSPPLLPRDPVTRARVRAFALAIACDIHPLNIMRVRKFLAVQGLSREQQAEWYRHWVDEGFAALEKELTGSTTRCCFGDEPTLADVCLVPQVYNADRFKLSMKGYPALRRIADHCASLPAFAAARPEAQPDVAEYNPNAEF